MLFSLFIGVCGLLLLLWTWFQFTHRGLLKVAASLPVPAKTLPILGHVHYALQGMGGITDLLLEKFFDSVAKGNDTFCVWAGPMPYIIVNKSTDIQKVLNNSSTAEKSPEYKYLQRFLGNGLITAPGHIWRISRRNINPMFASKNLERLTPIFNKISRQLVSKMSKLVQDDRGTVNLMDTMMTVSLQSICYLVLGSNTTVNTETEEFYGLKDASEEVLSMAMKQVLKVWLRVETILKFLLRDELKTLKTNIDRFILPYIKSNKENQKLPKARTDPISITHEDGLEETPGEDNNACDSKSLFDVYDVLNKDCTRFTEEDFKCEMLTLFVAEKLFQELSSVVGMDADMTLEDLLRMPYLDQVYKETLRWATIIPFTGRRTTTEIKLSDCTIPPDCTLAVSFYGVHMNPNLYPNPKQFDPERFSPDNIVKGEKYTYLPFSGGPRNCIGKKYAEAIVKTLVVQILREFKLTTTMDIYNLKKRLMITLVNAEGYNVTLHPREHPK